MGDRGPGTPADKPCAIVATTDASTGRACDAALVRCGFAVTLVDSGVDAVIAARYLAPAVILVDLQLRDTSGRETVDWLRSNPDLRPVPIVLLGTAAPTDAGRDRPHLTLPKPVSPANLQSLMQDLGMHAWPMANDAGRNR